MGRLAQKALESEDTLATSLRKSSYDDDDDDDDVQDILQLAERVISKRQRLKQICQLYRECYATGKDDRTSLFNSPSTSQRRGRSKANTSFLPPLYEEENG